jgi:hypothetical protein
MMSVAKSSDICSLPTPKACDTQLKNDPTLDPETCQLSSGDADPLCMRRPGGKIPANDRSRAKLWKDRTTH